MLEHVAGLGTVGGELSLAHVALVDLLVQVPRPHVVHQLRELGRGTERERSTFLTQLRRELSTVGAKAQSSCLLGRVSRVGEGHRAAAKRREWVRRENERREDSMKAHWIANVRERGVFIGRGQLIC